MTVSKCFYFKRLALTVSSGDRRVFVNECAFVLFSIVPVYMNTHSSSSLFLLLSLSLSCVFSTRVYVCAEKRTKYSHYYEVRMQDLLVVVSVGTSVDPLGPGLSLRFSMV